MQLSDFIVLGLGSNKSYQGDNCETLLKKACKQLSFLFTDFKMSSVYRTKPMYVENQDCFYNMVVCGFLREKISPDELLQKIHIIENLLGRNRELEIRNGPRSMDIDIEIFGNEKVSKSDLEIPHPRICERDFVLQPLNEILSNFFDSKFEKDCLSFINVEKIEKNEDNAILLLSSSNFLDE